MESLELYIKDKCRLLNCPYASEYGCISEDKELKIRNNGVNTCVLTPDGKIAVYYIDILSCKKW